MAPGSRVHLVFHVSLLKKKLGDKVLIGAHLPPNFNPDSPCWYPHKILARGLIKRNNKAVTRWLIQWVGALEEEATLFIATQISRKMSKLRRKEEGARTQISTVAIISKGAGMIQVHPKQAAQAQD